MELFFFYLSLLVFFFVSLSSLQFLLNKQKRGNLPPGSTGLPVIGESLEFFSTGVKGHPEKFIFDRIAKYSSNIFRTSLFGSPTVVFSGAPGNKFLFSNENKLVQGWWPKSAQILFGSSTDRSSDLTTINMEDLIRTRKVVHRFLKTESLQPHIGTMDHAVQEHFASDWGRGENNELTNVVSITKHFTFLLACRLFMSVEDPNHVAKLEAPFKVLATGLFSVPINLPGTRINRAIKASNIIRKELVALVKKRKIDLAKGAASPTQDILSHILSTSEVGDEEEEEDVADKILRLLVAGYDNTSTTLVSIIMYLADLPETYQGVYNEQMEIANSKAEGESLDLEDINRMKYSWNVGCEVMRLAPALGGTFREAISDFVYNGFSIQKGCKIYWSAHSTHRNPEYHQDPLKFDPSRFDGSGPAPYTFVPFGGGQRKCPGNEYARMVILVFMHHLVKRFKFEKVNPEEKIVFNPTPIPEKGLRLRIYPQNDVM